MDAAEQATDQQATASGRSDDAAAAETRGADATEPAAAEAQQPSTEAGHEPAAEADAAAAQAALEAPEVASEAAAAPGPPAPVGEAAAPPEPAEAAAADQPAAGEQQAALQGDGAIAPTAAAAETAPADDAQIPDAASIYAAQPPPAVGAKRALEADEAAAALPETADAQPGAAAASPAPPSPKRQRRSPAPGSWDTVLRLVVPQRRVGLIIGKQGATISDLQKTTGARIQVTPAVPLCDERVVVLSAPEVPSLPSNGAISALLGIHRVITTADPEPPGTPTVVKLLVGRSQVAAVLPPEQGAAGTGGSGVEAGATVKLLRAKHLPLTALSNDRAVEVSGSAEAVGAALTSLAARLRAHPAKQRPGSTPPLLAERIAATTKGPIARGGPPPPPPPRMGHGPPPPHIGRPQQYGAPAAYY